MSEYPFKEHQKDVYLGDGAYASFDGFQIWLWTCRDFRWESIALEPAAWGALQTFAENVGFA